MRVGDLVKHIASNEIGIITDAHRHRSYQEDTYRVYWLTDEEPVDDWWDGSDLEALCK